MRFLSEGLIDLGKVRMITIIHNECVGVRDENVFASRWQDIIERRHVLRLKQRYTEVPRLLMVLNRIFHIIRNFL